MVLNAFANVFRIAELRARLAYTIALLAVYRIGIFITTPGVNRAAMNVFMESQKKSGGLVNLFNLFSGGALEQMSIFGLGIMPYVSASIVMQLLTVVIPTLERLQKEGAAGRQKLNQFTRYGTIVLAIVQGIAIARGLASIGRVPRGRNSFFNFDQVVVPRDDFWFFLMTVITLVAGTAFIMWLGEKITDRGIGNGISLIIFAGIVARVPAAVKQLIDLTRSEVINGGAIVALAAFMLMIIALVVYMERGMRRIPVQYAKRVAGRGVFAGQATYFPMKVNSSGVIPPIFAGALLSFPATLSNWIPFLGAFDRGLLGNVWVHNGVFVVLIVLCSYFYTALTFRSDDVADNIKKQGGYIPGIRPGRQTSSFIERVLNRITFGGAIYLATVCIIPSIISSLVGVSFPFGGTALLIVVGVALDTVQQIEGHLISRNYEGFAGPKGHRIRGRIRAAA